MIVLLASVWLGTVLGALALCRAASYGDDASDGVSSNNGKDPREG